MHGHGLAMVQQLTQAQRKYGFAYVDGCPATPDATQKLLERIAFIRHTHYGKYSHRNG